MPHTYLITGGGGNLACQLSFDLVCAGHRLILLDVADRPAGPVAEGCLYLQGDLTQTDHVRTIVQQHRPDGILHFASLLSNSTEANRPAGWRINVDASFTLFEIALAEGVRQLLFTSSVASYGGALPNPLPEDHPQWPEGLYGVTKVAVERLGFYYHVRHGLDFRCVRLPIVLSPHAPPGAASAYASRLFIDSVRTGRFSFNVRPESRPALIYVKDVLHGIKALLEAPADRLTRRAYNVHALSPTARELADAVRGRLPRADIRFDPDPQLSRLIESWPIRICDESARRDWGWQPRYDLERLADDFIEELKRGPASAPGV